MAEEKKVTTVACGGCNGRGTVSTSYAFAPAIGMAGFSLGIPAFLESPRRATCRTCNRRCRLPVAA